MPDLQLEYSTIEKLTIRNTPDYLGTINVFFEDFDPGQGKVTIENQCESWSYYWGNMGHDNVKSFFSKAGTSYIISKLSIGINRNLPDESGEAMEQALKKEILDQRKTKDLTENEARELWDRCQGLDDCLLRNEELFYDVFGPDYYYCLPTKPNPKFDYLKKIVNVIKEALKGKYYVTCE